MTNVSALPEQLRNNGRFCVWRYEERDGKTTKVPYNPRTGGGAQSNNPSTFAPVAVAEAAQDRYDGMGLGIFDGYSAIDIDHCIDDQGQLSEMATDIIATMETYTEYSPSGRGIRILFKAPGLIYDKARYYINKQSIGLEVYVAGATNKYVTVTGNPVTPGQDIEERGSELQIILDKYMKREQDNQDANQPPPQARDLFADNGDDDFDLVARAMKAHNGTAFSQLWNGQTSGYESASEADMALCNMLAFWTNRNADRMDRLFRLSGLMRDKWDRQQSGTTYGAITIQEAITKCRNTYNPQAHFEKRAAQFTTGTGTNKRTLSDLHPEKNERYGWHDMGSGYLFADWYQDIARYVPERKKWYVYDGRVWREDLGDLQVMELAKKLGDSLMIYALSLQDEGLKQNYMKHVARWQRRGFRETIIRDAASVYPIKIAAFDADPFIFNCLNGTLDLRTGEFHKHLPADLLSKLAGVNYDPRVKSERWTRFIDEIMQGDQDKAEFLQKSLGYALTGDTRRECFFILYGPTTRNGKGTTMETYKQLVGDYGKAARPDTVAQKNNPNASGPNEDMARLIGARFVNISEPDKRLVLSAALIKTMTGQDTINARYLYENTIEYVPQYKLFINTNHLPTVTDTTVFESGRVKIIPFERHFPYEEQDQGLKAELTQPENLSGILNWCLEGLRLIEETGFDAPDSVRNATEDYRRSSDKISRFLEDEFEQDSLAETRTSEAYSRYKSWCQANGFFPENSSNFKNLISSSTNVVKRRPKSGGEKTTLILGYRLIPDFPEFEGRSYHNGDGWG